MVRNSILINIFNKQSINIMSFLQELWEQLDAKKGTQEFPRFEENEIHKGYRTIPIQKLDSKPAKQKTKLTGQDLWNQNRIILTYEENTPLTHTADNGFFSCFYQAYINHGDLMIKPDDIWLTIMLWFTKYVDDNAEQLRTAFVSHAGKKKLTVHTRSSDQREWGEFFQKVIQQIRMNTNKGVTEKLQCNFTSTGVFERLFSTAIVMNSFKKYFDYERMGGGCGIQNVHMGGTLQDWQKVRSKLQNLKQFDVDGRLKKYIKGLKPVIEQLIETYKGFAHIQFWNNIYQERKNPSQRQYMPSTFIDGWLIKFFTTRDQVSEQLELEQISVDITYVNLETRVTKLLKLIGGSKGYSIQQKCIYRPHFSFVIAEIKPKYPIKIHQPKPVVVREPLKMSKVVFGGEIIQSRKNDGQIHSRVTQNPRLK